MSMKYLDMTAFPLTNVLRILVRFWIFVQRRRTRVSLQKQHGKPLRNMWRGWNKHKHPLERPQPAYEAVSEPHYTADVCSVNDLSINGRENP